MKNFTTRLFICQFLDNKKLKFYFFENSIIFIENDSFKRKMRIEKETFLNSLMFHLFEYEGLFFSGSDMKAF